MKRSVFIRPHSVVLASLPYLCVGSATAQSAPAASSAPIPAMLAARTAQSPMRMQLETLAAPQQMRALAWLQSFSYPQTDVASLRIDRAGGVYYSDAIKPKPGARVIAQAATANATSTIVDAFKLHSRPAAAKKVYLDFNGHVVRGTAWNDIVDVYDASPYDLDGNPAAFNADERSKIAEIWHRVAEDYSPFDIDVTTEEPTRFGVNIGRVVITKDTDLAGIDMPSKGSAGVAYVNVFGFGDFVSRYSPAFVYYNVLDDGYAPYVAEVAAHEFGHNLGLSHDGTYDGSSNTFCINNNEYFCGMGSGSVSWAPIMGAGYYTSVTQWSKGEYLNANNQQDDIALITDKLGLRPDDTKSAFAQAKPMSLGGNGAIVSTNPENDPGNTKPLNKGVIESIVDADTFVFDAGTGSAVIAVNPAWDAYYRSDNRGANLDVKASLYDAGGNLVLTADSANETNALISTRLTAGRYFLTVNGVGNGITPYSDYGSEGEYFISGQVAVPVTAGDTTPPSPNPMIWVTEPYVMHDGNLSMTASVAADEISQVEYLFRCRSGGAGCADSGWQTSRRFIVNNPVPGSTYTYDVLARDQSGNLTTATTSASVAIPFNQQPLAASDAATLHVQSMTMIDKTTLQVVVGSEAINLPVLVNDRDPDGNVISILSVGSAKFGTLTHDGRKITYTPKNNGVFRFDTNGQNWVDFFAGDRFTYTLSDGHGGTVTGTVTVTPDQIIGV
jgi:Bacterial Ig domain/Metallo-peptidase family M12B Reprolysin-like